MMKQYGITVCTIPTAVNAVSSLLNYCENKVIVFLPGCFESFCKTYTW